MKYAYNAIKKIFLCSPANELKPTFQRELAEFALFVVATLLIHRGFSYSLATKKARDLHFHVVFISLLLHTHDSFTVALMLKNDLKVHRTQ